MNGEFIGGCDILVQMHKDGEIEDLLKKHGLLQTKTTPASDQSGNRQTWRNTLNWHFSINWVLKIVSFICFSFFHCCLRKIILQNDEMTNHYVLKSFKLKHDLLFHISRSSDEIESRACIKRQAHIISCFFCARYSRSSSYFIHDWSLTWL